MSINTSEIEMYILSSDRKDICTKVSITGLTNVTEETSQLCPMKYDAATYDSDRYIRHTTAHNDKCDFFLHLWTGKITIF